MPKQLLTRAEGVVLLSRLMNASKNTSPEETKEDSKTDKKENFNKGNSGSSSRGSSGGSGGSSGGGSSRGSGSGGNPSTPSKNIAKTAQTKLIDLGRSQYVVVSFEEGFSKDNTCLLYTSNWHYNCSRWLDYWGSFTAGYFQICEKQNG